MTSSTSTSAGSAAAHRRSGKPGREPIESALGRDKGSRIGGDTRRAGLAASLEVIAPRENIAILHRSPTENRLFAHVRSMWTPCGEAFAGQRIDCPVSPLFEGSAPANRPGALGTRPELINARPGRTSRPTLNWHISQPGSSLP